MTFKANTDTTTGRAIYSNVGVLVLAGTATTHWVADVFGIELVNLIPRRHLHFGDGADGPGVASTTVPLSG